MRNKTLVRVLEVPEFRGQFHFNGPSIEPFLEHDFFHSETSDGLIDFVKRKPYYKEGRSFLILGFDFALLIPKEIEHV